MRKKGEKKGKKEGRRDKKGENVSEERSKSKWGLRYINMVTLNELKNWNENFSNWNSHSFHFSTNYSRRYTFLKFTNVKFSVTSIFPPSSLSPPSSFSLSLSSTNILTSVTHRL